MHTIHVNQGNQDCQVGRDGLGVEYAKPELLSSCIGVCSTPNINSFNRFSLQGNDGIPTELNYFLLTQGCKITLPSQWNIYCTSGRIHLPQAWRSLVSSAAQHVDPQSESGQWLPPTTSLHLQYWMSQQGSPARKMVQQALPVDHSNFLKPRRVL